MRGPLRLMYGSPPEPRSRMTEEAIAEAIAKMAEERAEREADDQVRAGLRRLLPRLKGALMVAGVSLNVDEAAALSFLESIAQTGKK